jgi:cytochrome c-type biogenesis protein CcsB
MEVFMRKWMLMVGVMVVALVCGRAAALPMDQAKPGEGAAAPAIDPHGGVAGAPGMAGAGPVAPGGDAPVVTATSAAERAAFEKGLQLAEFRKLAVMHMDQVKILDSWARQSISKIRHRSTIDGKDSLVAALDLVFLRDDYVERNIIYVQSVPIRQGLRDFAQDAAEKERIVHEGLVSYAFLTRPDVTQYLNQLSADAKATKGVGQVIDAAQTFFNLAGTLQICPPDAEHRTSPWMHPASLWANFPEGAKALAADGKTGTPVAGYSADQSRRIWLAVMQMRDGWAAGDAGIVNTGMSTLAKILPTIDAEWYPSATKRSVELWYNRSFAGTILDVFVYFIAMTLFLLVAVGVNQKLENKALAVFALAVAIHIAATAVRWWLAGRIPIKNQFESVLGAALIGCVVGLILECWKKNGIFGMAFSFVGFLAMTACFTFPFVIGQDIGASIGKVAGILDDYWLYIHVNIVIASYALIAATFVVGAVYLLMKQWYWINPIEPGFEEGGELTGGRGGGGGGTAAVALPAMAMQVQAQRARTLEVLDAANIVILQMAFWFLGIGIICGAVWADHSWGRPWGWDPKETFALVTWIVYLIIVHLRLVTKAKADWTAWLSIVGFGVMMFNWIGVNFWLVGLHSYA